jgi:phosphatidylserine/phosphatidylglycerophosphate/cardiolipin synthase-like enzyme
VSLGFLSIAFLNRLGNTYHAYMQPYATTVNKTHFIIGSGNSPSGQQLPNHHRVHERVLFSPDDDIAHELLTLINHEKKAIRVAIFTFTDKRIAQALIDAHARGVCVEVVADTAYLRDQYSKIPLLQQHNIPVFTYNPHYKSARSKKKEQLGIMHHKFIIFEQNNANETVIVFGSYNLTRSANLYNQEHLVISNNQEVIMPFKHQFELLKKRCARS